MGELTILFRIPFTRIFIGLESDGTWIGSWFDFYRKEFIGVPDEQPYRWERV